MVAQGVIKESDTDGSSSSSSTNISNNVFSIAGLQLKLSLIAAAGNQVEARLEVVNGGNGRQLN